MTEFSEADAPETGFGHLRPTSSGRLLDLIEEIRAKGVGDVVSLPQLVVCGDQSAGKSSVLEGITGVPFPRKDGLCTRFPTEIILRHARESGKSIIASIRPHASRAPDIQRTLADYREDIADVAHLPRVIDEVSQRMNIRGYNDEGGRAFTADALRIEITGAIGLHLSVVDLPGLIAVSNDEQTQEDVDAVHDMVGSYLQNPRTIILAVLQANNDMANQPIIKLARKHDPLGERTVGIITKPDLINKGAEGRLALVAKNQDSIKLKLGFFLLKNPNLQELEEGLTMEARSARELRFFSRAEWASQTLDMDRVGIVKLQGFLQKLLDAHIERELPSVRDEIKKALNVTNQRLVDLGDARPTIGHIRSFITDLSMRFHQLLQAALDGSYHSIDTTFFEQPNSRLRARIQDIDTSFARHMRVHGKRRMVSSTGGPIDSTPKFDTPDDNETADESIQHIISNKTMTEWIKQVYSRTRGRELPGNHNPAFLAELFREQSSLWPSLAEDHINTVLHIVSQWTRQAMDRIVSEDDVRKRIHALLEDWLGHTEQLALGEVTKLVQDERRDPLTYNHYYTDNVQKAWLDRQKKAMRDAITRVMAEDHHGKLHISNIRDDIDKFISSVESRITVDMDEQACNEAATQLDAYYKVSLKTFIDNVTRQIVERHILAPFPDAFSPTSVSLFSDDDLLRIGTEPEQRAAERLRLGKIAQDLKQSLADLQQPL